MKYYTKLLLRWSWLILTITSLAGATAYIVSQRQIPVYEATSTLLVNQAPNKNSSNYDTLLTSEGVARTYAQLLNKRPILEEVIGNLKLNMEAGNLSNRVSTSVVHDTQLILLTVEDTNPQRAADIANEISRVFNEQIRPLQIKHYADSKQNLQSELASLQADIDRTKSRIDSLEKVTTIEGNSERNQLEVLMAQYRSSYASLLDSYEEIRLLENQATIMLEVAEAAKPKSVPIRPNTTQNILLAVIVGFVLSMSLVFLVEYLDDTIKSREEINEVFGYDPLVNIRHLKTNALTEQIAPVIGGSNSVYQTFQILAANIVLQQTPDRTSTILVTSSEKQEGKSLTAAGVAIAIARAGKSVIIVDLNLHRPTLHTFFRLPSLQGVTTALLSRDLENQRLDNYLLSTSTNGLRLMPSGLLPARPIELFELEGLANFIGELAVKADVVVIDSPPLLGAAETLLLTQLCDITLFVVRASVTRLASLKRAADLMVQPRLAIVLNDVASTPYGPYRSWWERLNISALLRKRTPVISGDSASGMVNSEAIKPVRNT
jgi:non-specific protein-tyrosine kinase